MRPSTSARPQVKWPLSTVPELAEATAGISDVFSVKWDIWSHTANTSEKKHQVSWFWMILDDFGWFWGVQVYSSLFIDMSQDHIASVRQPPWAAIRGFGAMPASLFFWTKLCKFAMRSQCFFKAENLSVSVFFLTIKQLQHLESYLPSVNSWNCHLRQDAASFGLRVDSELGI